MPSGRSGTAATTGRPNSSPRPTGAASRSPTTWAPRRWRSRPSVPASTVTRSRRRPTSPSPPSRARPAGSKWSASCASTTGRSPRIDTGCDPAGRRPTGRGSAGAPLLASLLEEVDQHVVAQVVRRGEERPSPVQLHHALDEAAQVVALIEHEGVDADALARAAHHLFERLLDGDRRRRVLEERFTTFDVGCLLY